MDKDIFARAKPSLVEISETYQYNAIISANPTIDEKGQPTGTIKIEVPLDGYKYLTQKAYKDINQSYYQSDVPLHAKIGYLAVAGIGPEQFWNNPEAIADRTVLPIRIPLPEKKYDLKQLVSDKKKIILEHTYHPEWPEVHPSPRLLSFKVIIFDEQEMQETLENDEDPNWSRIIQEFSFEHSLFFKFQIQIAVPSTISVSCIQIKKMQLEWPVATSYKMLNLTISEPGESAREQKELYYVSETGSVEWNNVPLFEEEIPENSSDVIMSQGEVARIYYAPEMILEVREPGELYDKKELKSCLEIELIDVLLSGVQAHYFNAAGFPEKSTDITRSSSIIADININLRQRFDRKVFSPHQRLQFEGVILEEARMMDIQNLLKDLGFKTRGFFNLLKTSHDNQRRYAIYGSKVEGSDEMHIWIVASGMLAPTERETIIPGGKTFKTKVISGNMVLDLHTQLTGNVNKLMKIMNSMHISLKERFHHVIVID